MDIVKDSVLGIEDSQLRILESEELVQSLAVSIGGASLLKSDTALESVLFLKGPPYLRWPMIM